MNTRQKGPKADVPSTMLAPAEACTGVQQQQQQQQQGVLLYYCYVILDAAAKAQMSGWYESLCSRLGQRGRVRVADDGVNVTVGGSYEGLESHVAAAISHPLLGSGVDYKLAAAAGACSGVARQESKFDCLNIRLCKELVTLGPLAVGRADPLRNTGRYLSPQQFHQMLLDAAAAKTCAATSTRQVPTCTNTFTGLGNSSRSLQDDADGVVLVDVRNLYESRIGHFSAVCVADALAIKAEMRLGAVPLLLSKTRCLSDLPTWLDKHEAELQGRKVLMYCTGGVRCERASAYLKDKGPGFQDIYQLHGGIQRYLEAYSDGGLFQGKNFVFDERLTVGPADSETNAVATALAPVPAAQSGINFGGTSALAETSCDAALAWQQLAEGQPGHAVGCAACMSSALDQALGTGTGQGCCSRVVGECLVCGARCDDYGARTRCRRCRLLVLLCKPCQIACTANAARNALLCELCHQHDGATWDAVQENTAGPSAGPKGATTMQHVNHKQRHATTTPAMAVSGPTHPLPCPRSLRPISPLQPPPLRILCLHGFRQTARQFAGRAAALRRRLQNVAELVFVDAPHLLPLFMLQQPPTPCKSDNDAQRPLALKGGDTTLASTEEPAVASNTMSTTRSIPAGHDSSGTGSVLPGRFDCSPKSLPPDSCDSGAGLMQADDVSTSSQTSGRLCIDAGGVLLAIPPLAEGPGASAVQAALKVPVAAYAATSGAPAVTGAVASPPVSAPALATVGATAHASTLPMSPAPVRALGLSPLNKTGTLPQMNRTLPITGPGTDPTITTRHNADETSCSKQDAGACGQHSSNASMRKRAWLVSPQLLEMCSDPTADTWQVAPNFVAAEQHQGQTMGWEASRQLLSSFLQKEGPFDGVLGFSQGASIAAVLCALQQQQQQQQQQQEAAGSSSPVQPVTAVLSGPAPAPWLAFRFAVLASGFPSPCPEHAALHALVGLLQIPSLHVYADGHEGVDRQVARQQSEALMDLFALPGRQCLRHASGHFIPATKSQGGAVTEFLTQFQRRLRTGH